MKAAQGFTEPGVAVLSSVLLSARAISMNIAIMRTFVRLTEILAENTALRRKLEQHDEQITQLFLILCQMFEAPKELEKKFGFHS
jgi:hypothetical protein